MGLLSKLFGRAGGNAGPPGLPEAQASAPTAPPSDARGWLAQAGERPYIWREHGELALPSREIFVGDPTWGDDYHLRQTGSVDVDALTVWVLDAGPQDSIYASHVNGLVWLQAGGGVPRCVGARLDFGVDAACMALGDVATGRAFAELTDLEQDAGRGDSFDWIQPYLEEHPNYARWLSIPPGGLPMFVASTGNDGGFAAAWLHDEAGALSGILIDIQGRASDGRFLDGLLPPRDST